VRLHDPWVLAPAGPDAAPPPAGHVRSRAAAPLLAACLLLAVAAVVLDVRNRDVADPLVGPRAWTSGERRLPLGAATRLGAHAAAAAPAAAVPRRPAVPGGRLRLPARLTLAGTALLPLVLLLVPSAAATRFHGEPLPEAVRNLALDPLSVPLPYPVWAVLLGVTQVALFTSLVVPCSWCWAGSAAPRWSAGRS
jgi:hypothetical protein